MIICRFTKNLENDLRRGYSHLAGYTTDDTPANRQELEKKRRLYAKTGLRLSLRSFEGKIGLMDLRDKGGLSFHHIHDNDYKAFIRKMRKQFRSEDYELKITPKALKSNFEQIDCIQLRTELKAYIFSGELTESQIINSFEEYLAKN